MRLSAFCISLRHREDRRKAFSQAWAAAKLDDLFDLTYLPATEVDARITGQARVSACDMACAVSHRRAVEFAVLANHEGVAVFEDDALPCQESIAGLRDFLFRDVASLPVAWQTINLGGCSAQWRPATPALRAERLAPSVLRVRGLVTTHAMIYHRSVFEDVLLSVPSPLEFAAGGCYSVRPYDQWLASHGTMLTGTVPYFTQSGETSDILGVPHGTSIDKLIRDTYARLRSTEPQPSLA